MEVEKLKLLKGRFDPKTLVAGKKGRADCLIRHRKHMHLQSHKFFIQATQSPRPSLILESNLHSRLTENELRSIAWQHRN
jgi:hypothetical protein